MFELHNAHAETEKAEDRNGSSTTGSRRGWELALDICMVVLMGGILFWGATSQFPNQFNDSTRYQCYAVAFWHVTPGLTTLPQKQCAFLSATTSSTLATKLKGRGFPGILVRLVESQSTTQPLHALPPEYPLLTLVPFSLALVVPQQLYQVAYAIWMALAAAGIYFMLLRYRSRTAGIVIAVFLEFGNWAAAVRSFYLFMGWLRLGALMLVSQGES